MSKPEVLPREGQNRTERQQTAAVNRFTGKFWCSSSAHMAAGEPVMVNGRQICSSCAAKRQRVMKGKARG